MVEAPTSLDQSTDQPHDTPPNRARVWTLVVACLGVLVVMSSMVALNTALADIAVQTSASQTQLTWIVDSYTLTLACLLLPAGAIGDRYGRRGALVFGLVVFACASAAPIIISDATTLIIARAVAGAGAAFIMPATLSLLTTAYPAEQRAKAVGIWAGVAGCGGVVGMLGSGALLHFWSWPAIFWAFTGVAVVLVPLSLSIATSRDEADRPVDWRGAAVIGSAVAALVFGMLEAPARGWGHPVVWGCVIAGTALGALFVAIELRRPYPLLDVRLFADTTFTTGAAAITVFFLAMFGFFFLAMQYIQLVMGYDAITTALALSPLIGPMLLLSALSFWYVPRLGLRLVVFVGLLLVAGGFLGMRGLELGSPYWELAWPLLILSSGIGLCTAPTTSAIMTSVPDDKQGVASAVNDTTREVGAALGIALTGSMLASGYTAALRPHLGAFPPEIRAAATRSLGEALGISERIGPLGAQLSELSRGAFLQAMQSTVLVLALVVACGACGIALWAPGRDGSQLALVRALRRSPQAKPPADD